MCIRDRYWASRQTLEEARRYVLNADTLDAAFKRTCEMFGVDLAKYSVMTKTGLRTREMFSFPDGSGIWFAHIPELHGTDPPF